MVSHYVLPDEALDREALRRGKSVYLGELVLPMLPAIVAERCSLIPGSDRLTISFLITIDPQSGQVVEWEIQPSAINVETALTTEQAQEIIGDIAKPASLAKRLKTGKVESW
jgi:ribonuclease R